MVERMFTDEREPSSADRAARSQRYQRAMAWRAMAQYAGTAFRSAADRELSHQVAMNTRHAARATETVARRRRKLASGAGLDSKHEIM